MGYDNRIRTKYTAKWGVQIAGMIFQTRSSVFAQVRKDSEYKQTEEDNAMSNVSHLDALEAEAIYIMREVAAECEKPVMLYSCLLYTSPSPRDGLLSRMPSSA